MYLKVEVGLVKNVYLREIAEITIGENWVTDQIKQVIEMVKRSSADDATPSYSDTYIGLGEHMLFRSILWFDPWFL